MEGATSSVEPESLLSEAEKRLTARDFHGARSFAIQARELDPRTGTEFADRLIAVAETLIAGESRISDGRHHWYAILQLDGPTQSLKIIDAQYRRLTLLLSSENNRLSFADQAFRFVSDAWSVLSDPSKKADYDYALSICLASGPTQPPPTVRRSPRTKDGKVVDDSEDGPSSNHVTESNWQAQPTAESKRKARPPPNSKRPGRPTPESSRRKTWSAESGSTSFWTACPYCYVLYEYPKIYEEYTLRCQNCKRAFHAVMIPSPPVTDQDTYFCSWGFFPLGILCNAKDTSGSSSNWTPISPMFACPAQDAGETNRNVKNARRAYYDDDDDDEALLEVSELGEDSDDDWESDKRKTKAKKRASTSAKAKKPQNRRVKNGQTNDASDETLAGPKAESSKKEAAGEALKGGAAELGKVDLNVEFNNETEEPVQASNAGHREKDNTEGMGDFEGLDEFLRSLPFLKD